MGKHRHRKSDENENGDGLSKQLLEDAEEGVQRKGKKKKKKKNHESKIAEDPGEQDFCTCPRKKKKHKKKDIEGDPGEQENECIFPRKKRKHKKNHVEEMERAEEDKREQRPKKKKKSSNFDSDLTAFIKRESGSEYATVNCITTGDGLAETLLIEQKPLWNVIGRLSFLNEVPETPQKNSKKKKSKKKSKKSKKNMRHKEREALVGCVVLPLDSYENGLEIGEEDSARSSVGGEKAMNIDRICNVSSAGIESEMDKTTRRTEEGETRVVNALSPLRNDENRVVLHNESAIRSRIGGDESREHDIICRDGTSEEIESEVTPQRNRAKNRKADKANALFSLRNDENRVALGNALSKSGTGNSPGIVNPRKRKGSLNNLHLVGNHHEREKESPRKRKKSEHIAKRISSESLKDHHGIESAVRQKKKKRKKAVRDSSPMQEQDETPHQSVESDIDQPQPQLTPEPSDSAQTSGSEPENTLAEHAEAENSEAESNDESPKTELQEVSNSDTDKLVNAKQNRSFGTTLRHQNKYWTHQEDRRLVHNWKTYFKKYPANEPYCFLERKYLDADRAYIRKRILQTSFYKHLGKGIDRSKAGLISHARRIFNPLRDNKIQSEDREVLKDMCELGYTIPNIATEFNVPREKASNIYRLEVRSKKAERKGKWTAVEETALTEAISRLTGELPLEDVPWHCVSELVPGRNDKQCRAHWISHLYWSTVHKRDRRRFTKKTKLLLVESVAQSMVQMGVKLDTDIDWNWVRSRLDADIPSLAFLREKWKMLKNKFGASKLPLDEACEILKEELSSRGKRKGRDQHAKKKN